MASIWQPKLNCPTCSARLEELETSPPGAVGVCPSCGEFVRTLAIVVADERGAACPSCSAIVRSYLGVCIYSEAEAETNAHPEVLAFLRGIRDGIQGKA